MRNPINEIENSEIENEMKIDIDKLKRNKSKKWENEKRKCKLGGLQVKILKFEKLNENKLKRNQIEMWEIERKGIENWDIGKM